MDWDGSNPADPTELDGTQGLCPEGWYVPTDDDYKDLEMHLGMSQAQADGTAYRGTNEGDKLKDLEADWCNAETDCGISGFDALPAGYGWDGGTIYLEEDSGYWWTSTIASGTFVWRRRLRNISSQVARNDGAPASGFSARCIMVQ